MKKILIKTVYAIFYVAFASMMAIAIIATALGYGDRGLIDLF